MMQINKISISFIVFCTGLLEARHAPASKARESLCGETPVSAPVRRTRFDKEWHYESRDHLRIMADHILDRFYGAYEGQVCNAEAKWLDPARVKPGDLVLVHSEFFETFFRDIHPKITAPYVLLTHADPAPVPGCYADYLDDPKILAWFGHDPDGCTHPKFFGLPIGLASEFWPHGSTQLIKRMRDTYAGCDRPILAYLNISVNTYPQERGFVKEYFSGKPFCMVVNHRRSFEQYLYDVAHAKFVLSPRGNGIDCHRTWEAIMMGAIPVVRHSTLDPLFEGLPVLLIDEWSQVTPEFLEKAYKEIWSKDYDYSTIYHEFWEKKIRAVRDAALAEWHKKNS